MRAIYYCLITFFITISSGILQAETVYISDRLVVGLYEGKSGDTRLLKGLPTGTPLEILERESKLARVRTPDGIEGWIDASYTMTDKPSQLVVLELEDKYRTALNRLDAKEKEMAILRQMAGNPQDLPLQKVDTKELSNANATIARLESEKKNLRAQLEDARNKAQPSVINNLLQNFSIKTSVLSLEAIISLGVAIFIFGFFVGWKWLERHNMKRHGGFRI
ncbi:MAG: TIGR04211 family SH3 domain-containing protein [Gammaproteobacteria bacterium]|nr:TIGR04211 family SH3 domain-containing protein [Gammaproteobacteria bacterium]